MHKAQKPLKQPKVAKVAKKVAKAKKVTKTTTKRTKVTTTKAASVQQTAPTAAFKITPVSALPSFTPAVATFQQSAPVFNKPSFGATSFRSTKAQFAEEAADKKKLKDYLEFTITSPNSTPFKLAKGYAVYVATAHGERGILRGSKPLISTLRPGVIKVYSEKDQAPETTKKFFAPSGVVRVANDDHALEITASELIPVEELDGAAAQQLLATATAAAAAATDAAVKAEHTITMRVASAIIAAVNKYQKA